MVLTFGERGGYSSTQLKEMHALVLENVLANSSGNVLANEHCAGRGRRQGLPNSGRGGSASALSGYLAPVNLHVRGHGLRVSAHLRGVFYF